jgi:hypothetical protein
VVLTAVEPTEPVNLSHDTALRYRDALIFVWDKPLLDGGSKLQMYHLEIKDDLTETTYAYSLTV